MLGVGREGCSLSDVLPGCGVKIRGVGDGSRLRCRQARAQMSGSATDEPRFEGRDAVGSRPDLGRLNFAANI